MKKNLFTVWAIMAVLSSLSLSSFAKNEKDIVTPNKIQKEWADAEIGVMFHFDMPVYEENYNFRQWGSHPDASIFNPTELNTDQWIEASKKLGAKYAVLVAKHCSGFSLWPTEAHDYSVKNCPWKDGKGDIVADFIASCKKYGIKPGIYASTTANGYLYVDNPGLVQPGSPVTQQEYSAIVTQQLTELWTNYGDLFEIWFDGGVLSPKEGGADVLSLVQKYQPKSIAFCGPYGHKNLIRWVGNEEGTAPDPCWATADSTTNSGGVCVIRNDFTGDPNAPFWCPGESDFTLRNYATWFWREGQDSLVLDVDRLIHKYETSVGHNTNMLLGIVVDKRGLIPELDVKRMEEYGDAIRRYYGTPTAKTKGKGMMLKLKLKHATVCDRLVVQEKIAKGERVLVYHIEGVKADGSIVALASGTNIGHKHIARFEPTELKELRLVVDDCKAKPIFRSFQVFEVIK